MLLKNWKKWQCTICMKCAPEDAFNVDSWSKIISQASAIVFQFPVVLDVASFPIEEMAG